MNTCSPPSLAVAASLTVIVALLAVPSWAEASARLPSRLCGSRAISAWISPTKRATKAAVLSPAMSWPVTA